MRRRTFLAGAGAAAASCALPFGEPSPSPDALERIVADLSVEQKVGQLMSAAFHGTRITPHIEGMIRQRALGGIVIRTENAEDFSALARLSTDLQTIAREAKVPPLLLSIDHEGGPVTRVGKGMTIVPGQMALAANPDPLAAVDIANAITARELAAAGVRWNLAPVADVNDEPRNPVIANRSFGSDPQRVATLVARSVRAYLDARSLPTAKHFPGHGSTTVDSHSGLPEITGDRARLDAVELVPFRAAIAAGVQAVMTAHIVVPALEPTPGLPVTLSKRVMSDLLRGALGFKGLIVSDDLEMGALAAIGQAQAGLRAFEAGVDHLLFRFDEGAQIEGHELITHGVRAVRITSERLNSSVRRVIALKMSQGLYEAAPAPPVDFAANATAAMELHRGAITVLANGGALPLRGRALAVAYIAADIGQIPGDSDLATELAAMRPNTEARRFARADDGFIAAAVAAARQADVIVAGVADLGGKEDQRRLVAALAAVRPTVLVSLRGPYDALHAPGVAGIVCTYGGRVPTLRAVGEILTGARRPVGRLPVVIPGRFPIGAGLAQL